MKFKNGELVRIKSNIGRATHYYTVGDIVRICKFHESTYGNIYCTPVHCAESFTTDFFQWVSPEDLEPSKTALDYILEDL